MPENKTLNEDLFYKGLSANLPRLHTCKNKVPLWDFSQFAVTHCSKRIGTLVDITFTFRLVLLKIYLYMNSLTGFSMHIPGGWDGTHFGWPCISVRGSFWVYLRSDIDSRKLAFISCSLRPALLDPQGAIPQALTLPEGVRFIAWGLRRLFLGECRRSPGYFGECRACLGYVPTLP